MSHRHYHPATTPQVRVSSGHCHDSYSGNRGHCCNTYVPYYQPTIYGRRRHASRVIVRDDLIIYDDYYPSCPRLFFGLLNLIIVCALIAFLAALVMPIVAKAFLIIALIALVVIGFPAILTCGIENQRADAETPSQGMSNN